MTAQNINTTVETGKPAEKKNNLAAGLILVTIGLGLLLFQILDMPEAFPLTLGLIFLAAGIITRSAGLLIPGGIIGGAGLGTLSTVDGWFFPTNSVQSGGVFLMLFAAGWFSITLLSKLFTKEPQTWALIPGGIIFAVGGLTLLGEQGLRILELAGKFWPLILVIIGASILIGWWKERK